MGELAGSSTGLVHWDLMSGLHCCGEGRAGGSVQDLVCVCDM